MRILEEHSDKGIRISCTDCHVQGMWGAESLVCRHGNYTRMWHHTDYTLVKVIPLKTKKFVQPHPNREPVEWETTDD